MILCGWAVASRMAYLLSGATAGISLGANIGAGAKLAVSGGGSVNFNFNYHQNVD